MTCRLVLVLAIGVWLPLAAQPAVSSAVVLVTLDGARVEEIFEGLDLAVLESTLAAGQRAAEQPVYRRFWAPTAKERREKLMPFFWRTLMREHGSVAGNRALGSHVSPVNRHGFSYPGYAELLLGAAHDEAIRSNDPVQNPFPTVLEFLKERLRVGQEEVAVFASWSVFNAIAERTVGSLTVNAGFEPYASSTPDVARLSAMQFETPTPWDAVRHDIYTFRLAMDHLTRHRPRVLYLALGETDDWAHDGRYDRVLDAYARSDEYLRQLWTFLQSSREYRGRTSLLITTDHGRGRTVEDWRHHGEKYPGSNTTWIAVVSPSLSRRGEWRDHAPLTSAQVAATLVSWLGLDWRAFNPAAAPPIQ
jgi:hypothetical protein